MTLVRAIGLMSGTSMDGIDVAVVDTDGVNHVHPGPAREYAYPAAFKQKIASSLEDAKTIKGRGDRPGSLAEVEKEITKRHAEAVQQFLFETGIDAHSIDIIGFHGQTVLHRPGQALTVQLGDGQALADAVQIPVVFDLRANDMEHGGQGAPLVPVYHAALAANMAESVAFVNIGGISNVTFVCKGQDPVAFDSGPGNALIDQWVLAQAGVPYDDGGHIASEGFVDMERVEHCMAMPYFAKTPPKSLDRNDFSPDLVAGMELSNGARTLAAITAHSIFASHIHAPVQPRTWIICGGGRKNAILLNHLVELAEEKGARVIVAEEAGFDGGAMEAQAWAYLAVRSMKRLPITFPKTTGVKSPVSGGVLVKPKV
jgi:anhydro-N-acetylmuramic acid kinase